MDLSDYPLEAIVDYGMNEEQAKAFKVMLMFLVLFKKAFPNNVKYVLPKGDPRSCGLWKYCYKLVKEADLKDGDHKKYLWAQLMHYKKLDESHPLISAASIVGPKAWGIWLTWQKECEKRYIVEPIVAGDADILAELDYTKKYLEKSFGRVPTFEDIKGALESRALIRWAKLKQVSPYYLLLSPWIKKLVPGDLSAHFEIDFAQYHPGQGVVQYFAETFPTDS